MPVSSSFVYVGYAPERAQKDKELQSSAIRSHAARESHRRKTYHAKKWKPVRVQPRQPSQIRQTRHEVNLPSVQSSHLDGYIGHDIQKMSLQDVGDGMRDPFGVLSFWDVPDYAHQVIEYASSYTWRKMSNVDRFQNPLRIAVFQQVVDHPAVLHAVLFANILHMKLRQPKPDSDRMNLLCLRHRAQTVAYVNKELKSNHDDVSDAVLWAVGLLAVNGVIRDETAYQSYPLSPLATAQQLHLIGRTILEDVHLDSLYALAKTKGDSDAVSTPGFAAALECGDLMLSTRTGRRPGFKWRWGFDSLLSSDKFQPDAEAICFARRLGSQFLRSSIPIFSTSHHDTITMMCEVTVGLDQFHRNSAGSPTMAMLITARNDIQHRLLSLPPTLQHLSDDDILNDICRISLLIYSDLVLFPTPPHTHVRARYASSLILPVTMASQDLWIERRAFLTWAVMLGGIAAFRTPLRRFYLDQLCAHSQLRSITQLEDTMYGFLWWAPVCGPPATDLCSEVMQARLSRDHHVAHHR